MKVGRCIEPAQLRDQELAHPQIKSHGLGPQPPGFVKRSVVGTGFSFTCGGLWLHSSYQGRAESLQQRLCGLESLQHLLPDPLQTTFAGPCTRPQEKKKIKSNLFLKKKSGDFNFCNHRSRGSLLSLPSLPCPLLLLVARSGSSLLDRIVQVDLVIF